VAGQKSTQPSHDSSRSPGQAPHETPEMWGWHAQFGKWARVAGVIVAIALVIMITTTHYNDSGNVALFIVTGLLIIALIWDYQRRRTSWRQ
jgi:uncharacterized membrane protein YdcZ (DUF606 family)